MAQDGSRSRPLADSTRSNPTLFAATLKQLFAPMATGGGMFGAEPVPWFNGGLFDSDDVLQLTAPEIGTLLGVTRQTMHRKYRKVG